MRTKHVQSMNEPLSSIGLGCWAIGGAGVWSDSSDESSVATIRRAIELGVTVFDVAPVYGFGHAETVLGSVLKETGARQEVTIATKCGLIWDENDRIVRDLSPASIRREIDASLRRLQTDYVDIYQLHWPDPNVPLEETIRELQNQKKQGKVRSVGLSNFSRPQTLEALSLEPIVSCQGLYNLLERNPESYHSIPLEYRVEREVLPLCRDWGLAFFPYSPLMQGLLAGAYNEATAFSKDDVRSSNPKLNGPELTRRVNAVKELTELALSEGHPVSHLAIAWLVDNDAVTSVICGAQTPEQIQENVLAAQWSPGAEFFAGVDRILSRHGVID
jgi:aryl-alcohol dehydrogenase-like predicted oxidoreductase